jgi:hypothetical protein
MTTFESMSNGPSYQEIGEYFPEPAAKRQRIGHGHYQNSMIDTGNLTVPSGEGSQFHPISNLDTHDIPDDLWSFLDDSNQTSSAWPSHLNGSFETEENSRVLTYDQSIESALQGSLMDDVAFQDWQPQLLQVSAVEPSAGQVSLVESTMPEEIVEKDVCFGMVSFCSKRLRVLLKLTQSDLRHTDIDSSIKSFESRLLRYTLILLSTQPVNANWPLFNFWGDG